MKTWNAKSNLKYNKKLLNKNRSSRVNSRSEFVSRDTNNSKKLPLILRSYPSIRFPNGNHSGRTVGLAKFFKRSPRLQIASQIFMQKSLSNNAFVIFNSYRNRFWLTNQNTKFFCSCNRGINQISLK